MKVLEEREGRPGFFKQLMWQSLCRYRQEKKLFCLDTNPHLLFSHWISIDTCVNQSVILGLSFWTER